MKFSLLKKKANSLLHDAGWLAHIKNNEEYHTTLEFMDELIDDYDNNRPIIEILSVSIARWENESDSFANFNKEVEKINHGVALLKVLMEQHGLKASDLPEIGSKSLVSKILNGHRKLTLEDIKSICNKFNISPVHFFPTAND